MFWGKTKNGSVALNRLGEKKRGFNTSICWPGDVLPTLTTHCNFYRADDRCSISKEDIIHAQTFPEDYDFINESWARAAYICGMSVPPVMIKRLVLQLIERGLYDYKTKNEAEQ